MDNEISTSLDNTKSAEAQLKVDWKAIQLENTEGSDVMIESDPICSSSGCGQYAHPAPPAGPPMDYPVPSYGKDPDMVGTLNSLSISEKMNNHKLIMGTPESKANGITLPRILFTTIIQLSIRMLSTPTETSMLLKIYLVNKWSNLLMTQSAHPLDALNTNTQRRRRDIQ